MLSYASIWRSRCFTWQWEAFGIMLMPRHPFLWKRNLLEYQNNNRTSTTHTFTEALPGFEYLSHCFTETTLYSYPSHTTVKTLSLEYTLYSDQINIKMDVFTICKKCYDIRAKGSYWMCRKWEYLLCDLNMNYVSFRYIIINLKKVFYLFPT